MVRRMRAVAVPLLAVLSSLLLTTRGHADLIVEELLDPTHTNFPTFYSKVASSAASTSRESRRPASSPSPLVRFADVAAAGAL